MNLRPPRGALAVAAVYGYFLIFAQFAFVEVLRARGMAGAGEKVALGLMAAAGIGGGFCAAWRSGSARPERGARVALSGAAAAALALAWDGPAALCFAGAALCGGSLGFATVRMAMLLPGWCGVSWVGLGTGLGYAACNVPTLFNAPPAVQCAAGAVFAATGAWCVPAGGASPPVTVPRKHAWWPAILAFTALVWLDSAAFFIIQHSGELKEGTWGNAYLWRNAALHLGFALIAGRVLRAGSFTALLAAAWGMLAAAALAVNHADTRVWAGWLYPAAVSLYSTALVAWPGWFSGAADDRSRAWRAAWLFAVAGWFGSANGIGMAGSLREVPPGFVIASAFALLAFAWLRRGSFAEMLPALGVAVIAWAWPGRSGPRVSGSAPDPVRGRQVYVSEGCIHCHSRYPRPGSGEEIIWGPAIDPAKVTAESPVLIGNRRQGPDLANVGARRSESWLREHFLAPRSMVPDSVMPSYATLFRDRRGEDLIAFLKSSGIETLPRRMETATRWQPAAFAGTADGAALFGRHCAVCHGPRGAGDGAWAARFMRPPANLQQGPFVWTADGPDLPLRVMRAVKFGIPGTDMPGHETLDDDAIRALADEVIRMRVTPPR